MGGFGWTALTIASVKGHFELTRFCEVIKAKGYAGPVSCEVLSDATRDMDRLEFAQRVRFKYPYRPLPSGPTSAR